MVIQGIDIVGIYNFEFEYGDIIIIVLMNFVDQNFNFDFKVYFNNEVIYDFLNGMLVICGVLFVKYVMDDMLFIVCMNYFGGYLNFEGSNQVFVIQIFEFEVMFDLEGIYFISEMLFVLVGVCNLFDNYLDVGEIGEICCGCIYCFDFIVDWQGGYYYMCFNMSF